MPVKRIKLTDPTEDLLSSVFAVITKSTLTQFKMFSSLKNDPAIFGLALSGSPKKVIVYAIFTEPLAESNIIEKISKLTMGEVILSQVSDDETKMINNVNKNVLLYNINLDTRFFQLGAEHRKEQDPGFYFGSILFNVSEEKKLEVFNYLKDNQELSSLCVTFSSSHRNCTIFMGFKKPRTVFSVTRFLSKTIGEQQKIEIFRSDLNSLKIITDDDYQPLFSNCYDTLFSFGYKLHKWTMSTPIFDVNDTFVKTHRSLFCYIKAYWDMMYNKSMK